MSDIITWLIGVEGSAASLYEEAAIVFREDEDFSRFLSQMAVEEREHEKLLQKTRAAISDDEMKRASFHFDDDFRNKIEAPFSRALRLSKDGTLTKNAMVNVVADAEFSEWNEILLYTLDLLNILDDEVPQVILDFQKHRMRAQDYIASLPGGDSIILRVQRLARPGGKRALIVEDNLSVARMLEALALDQVEVIIARDGQEGLSFILERHFDLIISEIDLPKMNGVEMYKQALEKDPNIAKSFIFFTGTENPEHLDFVRSTNTLMLPKPSPVKLICEMMNDVLNPTTVPQDASIH
ncbi:MAG: response regulator [Desulfuromonadales bacterium]|nr:response regulator [Desulfuromonadales bacterium]